MQALNHHSSLSTKRLGNVFITSLFYFFVSLLSIQAAFIDNGNTVTDDVNMLEWFKADQSVNLSFNQMTLNFSNGSQFDGFRHATQAELQGLWAEHTPPLSVGPNNVTDLVAFTAIFGQTRGDGHIVIHAESSADPTRVDVAVLDGNGPFAIAPGVITFSSDLFLNSTASPIVGHAIVREVTAATVPEPSTYILFATLFGMVGIGVRRNRVANGLNTNSQEGDSHSQV